MCHAKRFGSATVAAVCVMATMAMPAVALGEGREVERPGARDAAAVEREASEFAAGWSWLDELGEVMRMLWDASRESSFPATTQPAARARPRSSRRTRKDCPGGVSHAGSDDDERGGPESVLGFR
jgi:hypothetical protein